MEDKKKSKIHVRWRKRKSNGTQNKKINTIFNSRKLLVLKKSTILKGHTVYLGKLTQNIKHWDILPKPLHFKGKKNHLHI